MSTTINGQETKVSVCRDWGAILLPGGMIVLDHYPLQELNDIKIPPMDPAMAAALAQAEPVTEQRQVTAKYRVTKRGWRQQHFVFAGAARPSIGGWRGDGAGRHYFQPG
jgi:hypothetical protein